MIRGADILHSHYLTTNKWESTLGASLANSQFIVNNLRPTRSARFRNVSCILRDHGRRQLGERRGRDSPSRPTLSALAPIAVTL